MGAVGARLRREHDQRAWTVWHIAALQRVQRMPKLEKLLSRTKEPRRQSWQEQMAIMGQWASVMRKVVR